MLEYLHLKNVGPAPEMEMDLAPRLNLVTGDNGLGKSFLLDVAWWALTRKWPHDLKREADVWLSRATHKRQAGSDHCLPGGVEGEERGLREQVRTS